MCGDYSIVDMATWPWIARHEWQRIDLSRFRHVRRWYLEIASRPAVQRGYKVPDPSAEIPIPA
jgi:GST-like protein